MKDTEYLNIGSTPPDEDCAQVGATEYDYQERSRVECRQYVEALRKKCGPEPLGAKLGVKSFQHDFGTYYEVVCHYNPDLPEACDYASKCEGEGPMTWEEVGMTAPFKYSHSGVAAD